jgi:putative transposase
MSDRPHRLPRFSYVGIHQYSLTFCTFQRQHVFLTAAVVAATLDQISHAAREHEFAILAYCFMPDHLHLLVEARSDASDLIAFAHAVKQRTAYEYRRRFENRALWQKGYFEHVVRDDESTRTQAKYVLENPVRSGLITEPLAYPFSGSLVFTREELTDLWRVGTP